MTGSERIRVGVVLERRQIVSAWRSHAWRAVAILPGAPETDGPRLLREGAGWAQYLMATRDIELYRSDAEGYRHNLSQAVPAVYVFWRVEDEDPEAWPAIFHVGVCPYEAQDYLDGGDVTVEGLPMPKSVAIWLADYVARQPVTAVFEKRKRQPQDGGARQPATAGEDEHG